MFRWLCLLLVCLALSACATGGASVAAPEPLKPVDPAVFFTGRWYEVARTPISLTTNCVAGTTDFLRKPWGELVERDECRVGSPAGKVRAFQGWVQMLNPGENTKFTVHYILYGVVPVAVTYWVLDHARDYSWFIVANPSFHNVAILGRVPRQPPSRVAILTAQLHAMGYDTSKLEYPPTFP